MIRFLHSGDWQLGMTRSVLDDEAHARYVEARFASIRRLGALAQDARCEFVVVAGDVFESNRVDRKTVARALDALHDVPVPVYLLPGNHDPLDAASLFQSDRFRQAAPPHVHVLDDTEPRPVAPGVELVGAPWRSRRPEANPALAVVEGLGPPGPIRILVAHGGADLLTPDRRDASMLPVAPLESALEARRLHYVALGDRHSTTSVGKSGRIFYAGTPEPTDFNERDPGQALVVELDHERVQVTPQRVGTWRFVQWDAFLLEEAGDVDELSRRLADTEAKERTVLRLELRGRIDLRAAAALDARLEAARDLLAGLDVRDAELERVGTNDDFEQVALGGFAAEAIQTLREESALPGEAGRTARDALALCLRLASEGAGRVKLLRLRLRHYRGTEEREIRLAPEGVTLIVGPNEIGKSSLFEALDLLFDELDNTTKQRVRDVKPVDRDAATEIEAELRVGGAHLTYEKRFHRKPATELRLHAPRVETWTGREAHEQALALLGEHVDLSLWRALRILQQTPLAPPNLADAPSLTTALDRVAGGAGEGEREGTLFDAAEAHYGEYFTPTGRDRKIARTLESRWEDARQESEATRQALEALEADVAEEARLRDVVAEAETGLATTSETLAALEAELENIEALRRSLAQRQAELDAALAVERESIQAARQRGQLVSAQTGAAAEVESLAEALESEEPAHIAAGAELRHVEENLAVAREARDQAHAVAEWARRDARFRRGERTLGELQARAERVTREQREVERARALLAGPEITSAQLQAIQEAQVIVDAARARLAAEGPMVTLQPEAALEVSVDGERRRIGPGQPLEARVSEALTLHVPGVGDLWVVAGAAVAERRKSLEEAETRLRGLCMEADVDDHAGAVAAVTARKAAREELSRSEARLAEALGKTDATALEARVATLARECDRYREARDATTPLPADLESAERTAEATAREAERTRASTEELDRRHADAARRFAHYEQHRSETRTRLELAERNRSDLTLRLEEARSQEDDEVLETNRDAASERVRELDARVQEARRALNDREPEVTESRARERRDARDTLGRQLREAQDGWVRVRERLEIAGNEGRFERWQEAERNQASAERALDRYRRRASAAARLFTALRDAREAQRRHYAAPLADAIAAMGRPLYGADFAVELDEELAVARRIAGGTALAPRQLSSGAQEQLSLLTRLAAAKLAGDVPLWLDDALGHTDPQRLAALGPLIAAAGEAHQVLVLTCDPERFRSVTGARIVALD